MHREAQASPTFLPEMLKIVGQYRLPPAGLRRKVIGLAGEHRADTVLIEKAGFGLLFLQELRANLPPWMPLPIGVTPKGDKDRLLAQSGKIEGGQVYLPREAPWACRLPARSSRIPQRQA